MKLTLSRQALLEPLQRVSGVVEKRQTLPILSNILLDASTGMSLSVTGTDLEVELAATIDLEEAAIEKGKITVPGRKLVDICRNLPEDANIKLSVNDKGKLIINSGNSRFSLSTLPSNDFPLIKKDTGSTEFVMSQKDLLYLLSRSHIAMAQQDVRTYLNGMLLEIKDNKIRTVATDGHRLALNTIPSPRTDNASIKVIMPRKGILELMRLLSDSDDDVTVSINSNHITVEGNGFGFTSKLVEGNFPDYTRVIPRGGDKIISAEKDDLKQSLIRASILSNEKFRGIRFQLRPDMLRVLANNPEQEQAEEDIHISYQQEDLDVGFNVSYLLDILNTIDSNRVRLTFANAETSVLIEESGGDGNSLFVVMPMRL